MSETKIDPIFEGRPEEVSVQDLKEFMAAHPELFPGILGESATRLVMGEQSLSEVEPDAQLTSPEQVSKEVVLDSDGWSRLLIKTPAEGIGVLFKGRHDLPELEIIGSSNVGVSVRPPYHDEPRDHLGALKSEQQIAYSGSHGGDPRLLAQRDGAHIVVSRALEKAEGKDVVLICDETPQGFRALFQSLRGLVRDEELSDTALRLCQAEYDMSAEPNPEVMGLFSELATELTAALTSEDLTPHEALELVFLAHVGAPATRKAHTEKLNEIIKERLKKDYFGEDEPEVHEARKQELIDAVEDPERNDFYVHRDRGVLRPGSLVLTGGSYMDYPRYTTHGCLNVAIDVERNVYGSGGHGVAEGSGSTTIASPMGEFVKVNGMPVNLEAADTYFINHQGLVIPEGSLFVTVSPNRPPEDLSASEIWLPLTITDEDIDNGIMQSIADAVGSSIYASTLSDEERSKLSWTLERVMRSVDGSWQVQSLATTLIVQSEIKHIMESQGLNEKQAQDEYYRRIREVRLGYEFAEQVVIDGVKLKDIPYAENAKKIAIETALDRLMSRSSVLLSGTNFSVNESGGIDIPINITEELKSPEGLEDMMSVVRNSVAFRRLSPEKQAEFLSKLSEFYTHLPSDELLGEKRSDGYGYSHEWGYNVSNQASRVLQVRCDELSKTLAETSGTTIYALFEQAKESNLAITLKNENIYFDIYAATLAIHGGGSEEEIRMRYDELLAQSHKEASGTIRAERLRDWVAYNIIDQDEFTSLHTSMRETSLAQARSQRRTDYLQVWLTNTFISNVRGLPTPKLESFGRGLDWDVPGATEQIKKDYELAESVGIETARHADSYKTNNEGRVHTALANLKSSILNNPRKASYRDLIQVLKELPLGLASRYVRAGIISFDQTDYVHDSSRPRGL